MPRKSKGSTGLWGGERIKSTVRLDEKLMKAIAHIAIDMDKSKDETIEEALSQFAEKAGYKKEGEK